MIGYSDPIAPLRVRLFGRFGVEVGAAQEQAHLASGRVQEVFCFLLLRGSKPHHREQLADTLWGQQPSRAR